MHVLLYKVIIGNYILYMVFIKFTHTAQPVNRNLPDKKVVAIFKIIVVIFRLKT